MTAGEGGSRPDQSLESALGVGGSRKTSSKAKNKEAGGQIFALTGGSKRNRKEEN